MMDKLYIITIVLLLSACSSLPTDYNSTPSYVMTDTQQTTLGKRSAESLRKSPDKSMMYLLNEGTDAFLARRVLMHVAERSIDVQYYIWHADLIGKVLFNGLIEAADRGVRVRILLDDINIDAEIEAILYAMDQHENIEVRLYNPFASRGFRVIDYVSDMFRINRRMHNKSFTVDSQYAVVGGRNIGNEYFSADEGSNFKDLDVMSIGPIVQDVGKQFDVYWNSKVVFPVKAFDHNDVTLNELEKVKKELAAFERSNDDSKYAQDLQDSELYKRLEKLKTKEEAPTLFKGYVKVIYDDPEKSLDKSEEEIVYLKSLLKPHIDKATKSFELISPYFVPGDSGTEYLTELVKKGIRVRVLTNSLSSTDGLMAQSGYARQRIALLEGGVELYELKAEFKTDASRSLRRGGKAKSGLHAKTYIFDREEIFIGSFNFDPRSANINAEVGVIYQIPEMAQLIAKSVFDDYILDSSYKLELLVEPEDVDGIMVDNKSPVWIETKDAKEIRHTTEPETSAGRRFMEDIFSILPIESQL